MRSDYLVFTYAACTAAQNQPCGPALEIQRYRRGFCAEIEYSPDLTTVKSGEYFNRVLYRTYDRSAYSFVTVTLFPSSLVNVTENFSL